MSIKAIFSGEIIKFETFDGRFWEGSINTFRKLYPKMANVKGKKRPDDELARFLAYCQSHRLMPGEQCMLTGTDQFVTSYHTYNQMANLTGACGGITMGLVWEEMETGRRVLDHAAGFSPKTHRPVAAWSNVVKMVDVNGKTEFVDFHTVCPLEEISESSPVWRRMPSWMAMKVAVSRALRMAFPIELASVFTQEEMGVDPEDPDVKIEGKASGTDEAIKEAEQLVGA